MSTHEEQFHKYSRYAGSESFHDINDPGKVLDESQILARERRHKGRIMHTVLKVLAALAIIAAAAALIWMYRTQITDFFHSAKAKICDYIHTPQTETESELYAGASTESETAPQTEPLTELVFTPAAVESTQPENLIEYTGIQINGEEMSDVTKYFSTSTIDLGYAEDYAQAEGIFTFRGNNFRNSAAVGTQNLSEGSLTTIWSQQTGSLTYNNASWTGSGWTGQPLMRKWTREEKKNMVMEDWAKEDDDLVEVIYACMDGYVYFLDLKTGEQTRDPLCLGWTFKGAGALDPRGYPILYVGAGYDSTNGRAHAFIVNLVDLTVMYEFGDTDDFSLRGTLSYFDSSPLVDAETDTLIWPGENGIIYLIHLNSSWNEETGEMTIDPGNVVKWHYWGVRSSVGSYWLGMEDSCAIYGGYLFVADNGGNLMCLDLNSLQLVWVQDTLDDSNSTPVLSNEGGHLYLYVSTSFRLGWRSSTTATIPIWKIDAETGEIVWQHDYECYTQDGVSGGVQSTIACGEKELSDYIYCTVAMTGSPSSGVCVCLDKETGDTVWEHDAFYAWSSPVCVYDDEGHGNVIYCSGAGIMYLLDGETGEVRTSVQLSDGVIEASPAVWDSYVVVGTRACRIWGIELG